MWINNMYNNHRHAELLTRLLHHYQTHPHDIKALYYLLKLEQQQASDKDSPSKYQPLFNDFIAGTRYMKDRDYPSAFHVTSVDEVDIILDHKQLKSLSFQLFNYSTKLYYEVITENQQGIQSYDYFRIDTPIRLHYLANKEHYQKETGKISLFVQQQQQKCIDAKVAMCLAGLGFQIEVLNFNKKDTAQATYWYHLAAQKGNLIAQTRLAQMILYQERFYRNYDLASSLLLDTLKSDYGYGIHLLANLYLDYKYKDRDYDIAAKLFSRSIEKGYFPSYQNLALLYKYDGWDKKDTKIALQWLQKGYQHLDDTPNYRSDKASLINELAHHYFEGIDIIKDETHACKLIQKAIELDDNKVTKSYIQRCTKKKDSTQKS